MQRFQFVINIHVNGSCLRRECVIFKLIASHGGLWDYRM